MRRPSGNSVIPATIQKYFGSAWDIIKDIYDNLAELISLAPLSESAEDLVELAENIDDVLLVNTNATEFNKHFLGAHETEPTVDGNGDPLAEGAQYWNSVNDVMYTFDGAKWVITTGFGTVTLTAATGNGVTTAFNLDIVPKSVNNTSVFIQGVYQEKDTYTIVGKQVVFNEAPLDGLSVEIVAVLASSFVSGSDKEYKTLASGQTVVEFVSSIGFATFYVSGDDTDSKRLILGTDYTSDLGTNEITLTDGYPAGTVIEMVYGFADDIPIDIANLRDLIDANTASINTNIDNITINANAIAEITSSKQYSKVLTLAQAVDNTQAAEGGIVVISDRGYGKFEYKVSQVATGRGIITCTGVTSLSLVVVKGENTTENYGLIGDLSNTSWDVLVLDELLANEDNIVLSAGIYPPYVFDDTNKQITISEGAWFKLPDNMTNAVTTEPARVVEITGNTIRFQGSLRVDGNFVNNPSDSMNTADRRGAVHVAGTNINFDNEVFVKDANWTAFSTGSEVDIAYDVFVDLLRVENPRVYATSLWSLDGAMFNRIEIKAGVDSLDARFRSGSQNTSTFNCENVTIGQILSNDSVVFEARTNDTTVGLIIADACKTEACSRVSISTIIIKDTSGTAFAFAMITCDGISVESVLVDRYAGTVGKAIALTEVIDCTLGTAMITNTQADNCSDLEIRSANGLTIDKVFCRSPDGINTRGFFFDYDAGYAPQKDIRIGSIVSTGHDIYDAEIQSPQLVDIVIRDLNEDATTNIEAYKNGSKYAEGVFPATLTPDSGTISLSGSQTDLAYTKNGRLVTVTGRLQVSALASATGGITLGTLPYAVIDAPDLGGYTQFLVVITNTTGAFSGVFYGTLTENGTTVYINGLDGNTQFSSADKLQVDTTLGFNFSYMTGVTN